MLLPESGEEYGGYGIAGQNPADIHYAAPVAVIAEHIGNISGKKHHQSKEKQAHCGDHAERIGIDLHRIGVRLVGESETPRFKTQDKYHLKHGDIRHELCHYTIAFSGQKSGVKRDKQEVYHQLMK